MLDASRRGLDSAGGMGSMVGGSSPGTPGSGGGMYPGGVGLAGAAVAAAAAGPPASAQLLAEFDSARHVLVQLMLSAYAFLDSEGVRGFFDGLGPLARVYASMHELPVVQKRYKCQEMAAMRDVLMQVHMLLLPPSPSPTTLHAH